MNHYFLTQEQAEDEVANCWVKIYNNREKLNSLSYVKRFSYFILKNQLIDNHRDRSKQIIARKEYAYLQSDEKAEDVLGDEMEYQKTAETLLERVKAIGGQTGRVLEMYFFENKTTPEVAKSLNISPQTALNLKSRGINLLRENWSKKPYISKINSRKKAPDEVPVTPPPQPVVAVQVVVPLVEIIFDPLAAGRWMQDRHLDEMMEKFREGEKEAFRYVFDLYNQLFWIYTYRFDIFEPREDVLADLWLILFERRAQFSDLKHIRNYGYFYLRHYPANFKIQQDRRNKAMAVLEREYIGRQWEDNSHLEEMQFRIRETLKRMGRVGSRVLELQFFEGMEISEIADLLGVGIKAIYKSRSSALALLRQELEIYRHLI